MHEKTKYTTRYYSIGFDDFDTLTHVRICRLHTRASWHLAFWGMNDKVMPTEVTTNSAYVACAFRF